MVATPLNPAQRFTGLDNVVAYWVETIADKTAPLRSELNAGIDLTGEVPKDGISGFTTTGQTVTADDLRSGFDAQLDNGFTAEDSSIQVYMSETGTDIRTLIERGDEGFVVLFDNEDVSGELMDVWPVKVLSCGKSRSGANPMMVTISFSITSAPALNVTVPS